MTPEMIEQWAREAGFLNGRCLIGDDVSAKWGAVERFASLAFAAGAEAMRRDAIQACEDHFSDGAMIVADAIRALPLPIESPCCAGGPQWGHAWSCKKCPD